jgi:hypothetical protein
LQWLAVAGNSTTVLASIELRLMLFIPSFPNDAPRKLGWKREIKGSTMLGECVVSVIVRDVQRLVFGIILAQFGQWE